MAQNNPNLDPNQRNTHESAPNSQARGSLRWLLPIFSGGFGGIVGSVAAGVTYQNGADAFSSVMIFGLTTALCAGLGFGVGYYVDNTPPGTRFQ